MVPGGYAQANSPTYVDHDSLRESLIPTQAEVNDMRSDLRHRVDEAISGS